jgi:hypothetical protein
MILKKVKAIAKRIGIDPRRVRIGELITGVHHAEGNDCFGSAFPLLFRVRSVELERQAGRR